jgi:hypothetical protein
MSRDGFRQLKQLKDIFDTAGLPISEEGMLTPGSWQ